MNQVSTIDASEKPSNDPSKRVSGGCFDCNICLDLAVEPVVTLCGHLYCGPCIYEWLRRNTISTRRPCPVCKATLTLDSLVPLYGRGGSRSNRPRIPRRPTVSREAAEQQSAQISGGTRSAVEQQSAQISGAALFDIPPPLGRGMNVMHSTAGRMAVALLPRVFRGQAPAPSAYYSSSYHLDALQNLSPRLRRQHMEVERSLHQLLFFLFVFVVQCLLLF